MPKLRKGESGSVQLTVAEFNVTPYNIGNCKK